MEQQEIFKFLEEKGIYTRQVMSRFDDDKKFYIQILKSFLLENDIENIEMYIKEKDYESAINHTVSLKGISGTLGFENIYQTSSILCDNLCQGQYDKVLIHVENIKKNVSSFRDILE